MDGPHRSRGRWPRNQGRGRYNRPYFKKRHPQISDDDNKSNGLTNSTPSSSSCLTTQQSQGATPVAVAPCPYPGWNLYFPNTEFDENSPTMAKIHAFEKFMELRPNLFAIDSIKKGQSFDLDVNELFSSVDFLALWPEFKDNLENQPEVSLGCLGLAVHQAILIQHKIDIESETIDPVDLNLGTVWARLRNTEPILPMSELKSIYYGKLVTVSGNVVRVGGPNLMVSSMAFECKACNNLMRCPQYEGVLSEPSKCTTTGCKSYTFIPLRSSPLTITHRMQNLRLQDVTRDQGRVPPIVDVVLTADLCEKWCPGDAVTITGIVKISAEEIKKGAAHIVPIYLKAVSVINNKNESGRGSGDEQFNMKDYYAVKTIHDEENLFRLLVHSLNPAIYGHEMVKAGLLLALFGGRERENTRADPHVLVVGDPGLGKSQMLKACADVAPKGIYVCGHMSTATGLTLSVRREGGEHTLEAGALVMANEGVCCIDEFDKMTNQYFALLDAMEGQKVSIAKHGVVCSMPARCSVLAAANPVGGHYNKAKTVSENLKLSSALLSRFDLVFILLDEPNAYLDVMLSEHVMGLQSGVKSSSRSSQVSSYLAHRATQGDGTLKQYLKLLPGEELDTVPQQLFRKYITYAKKYVKPKLSPEAATVIQQFYLELRQTQQGADSMPVTIRQLESLVRLTEARAKLELREIGTVGDAEQIIEIYKTSMADTWTDEVGKMDITRSFNGSGMSSRNIVKNFVAELQNISKREGRAIFTVSELKELSSSLPVPDFKDFVEKLNCQNLLLKKSAQTYELIV